ncbi:MAG: exopolysaccharide biosynthesis polyprenyl glycosylphosphotransferase, partial [Clostridiales bacterium]|nr:exopolysaccharide biosynthesis polyprenyl glycosylphosphotransferase [Clostridiales bacterium]
LMVMLVDRMGLTFEQRIVKRTIDIFISLLAIILSSPVILICAIIIKLSDGGPVFYRQERLTIDNRPYRIYKLRTMRQDAEVGTGAVISGKDDPRVTPFGKFLRRSKLDEFPQFFNVLKGDMSVVGPRSERPEFVANFEKEIPGYSQRFAVKAGITGLAQVAGNYDTTPQDKLRYDLLYIKNYSVLQDIKIMFLTLRAIFTPNLYNRTFEDNKSAFRSSDAVAARDNKNV